MLVSLVFVLKRGTIFKELTFFADRLNSRIMPKIKTHKATSKRFSLTKKNKLKQRKAGQDHFNARENGKTKRNKRRDIDSSPSFEKTIKNLIQK